MSRRVFLFNPYTGKPRHPSDIASDPEGFAIVEPDAPVLAALAVPEPTERLRHAASLARTALSDLIATGDRKVYAEALAALDEVLS